MDRATANLPARDFDATAAFYARLGFAPVWRDADWMILRRGPLELEFFPHPGLDPQQGWFSACIRVDDLDALHAAWSRLGLAIDRRAIPRITPLLHKPPVPRMFALIDSDGSPVR